MTNKLFSLALLALATPSHAVDIFNENFNSATLGSDAIFSESFTPVAGGTASYSVETEGAGQDYQSAITGTTGTVATIDAAAVTTTALSAANLGSNTFSISSAFTIDAFTSSSGATVNFALAAFGAGGDFSTTSRYQLVYTVAGTAIGKLTLVETGTGSTALTLGTLTSTGTLAPTVGLSGTLTLSGSYTGATLNLNGTLTSGATTLTVNTTDSTALTGTNFGYRTALNPSGGTNSLNVDYDNFVVSVVPEPTTYALMLGGVGILLLAKRRKIHH